MNTAEKTVKSFLLLVLSTICGFTVGMFVGGIAGLIMSSIMAPLDITYAFFAVFIGAARGLMWGSLIGLLSGLIYAVPRARDYYWLFAALGGIVGYFCGQSIITAPFINRTMPVWIPVFISMFSGAACGVLVAVVLQRITSEDSNS